MGHVAPSNGPGSLNLLCKRCGFGEPPSPGLAGSSESLLQPAPRNPQSPPLDADDFNGIKAAVAGASCKKSIGEVAPRRSSPPSPACHPQGPAVLAATSCTAPATACTGSKPAPRRCPGPSPSEQTPASREHPAPPIRPQSGSLPPASQLYWCSPGGAGWGPGTSCWQPAGVEPAAGEGPRLTSRLALGSVRERAGRTRVESPSSAPASSPSAWCRAVASVNQQRPLNRFLAGSASAPERGGTVQPRCSQTPLHPPRSPGCHPRQPHGAFPCPGAMDCPDQPCAGGTPAAPRLGPSRAANQPPAKRAGIAGFARGPAIMPGHLSPPDFATGAHAGCGAEVGGAAQQPWSRRGAVGDAAAGLRGGFADGRALLMELPWDSSAISSPFVFAARVFHVATAVACRGGIWCCTPRQSLSPPLAEIRESK